MATVVEAPTRRPLNEAEAAEHLGVKPQTLASWRCLGRYDLPFEKIGRLVRYRFEDLEAFRQSRRGVSTTAIEANLSA